MSPHRTIPDLGQFVDAEPPQDPPLRGDAGIDRKFAMVCQRRAAPGSPQGAAARRADASQCMVRIFQQVKGRPSRPMRTWPKKPGPAVKPGQRPGQEDQRQDHGQREEHERQIERAFDVAGVGAVPADRGASAWLCARWPSTSRM